MIKSKINAFFYLLFTALLFLGSAQAGVAESQDRSFVVVIPSYKNKEWCQRNLDSVFSQTYTHFRVIYVDDASPDGTGALVREYIQKYHLEDRVTLIQNEKRVGALANIYKAVWLCASNEIVVGLDGDDWFAHHEVLSELNQVYADSSVWLTYGQFIYYPSYQEGIGCEIPRDVVEKNEFRTYTRGTTALRTFYAGLFQQIKKEDLLYNGEFFPMAWDLAMFIPMLEMAGHHIAFVPQVSYVYNIGNPINDHKVNEGLQAELDRYVRRQSKYQPLLHFNQKGPVKKVYITPGLWGELFSIGNPIFNRDNCLDVMYRLREKAKESGFQLLQADQLDPSEEFEYLIVYDVFLDQLPYLERFPKEKLILFLWEPPSVIPENYNVENHRIFSKVFTWNDALVDNTKYFKFFYPVQRPMIANPIGYEWKRLCTLVSCNKESSFPTELYTARRQLIDFFESFSNDDFDLYGKWWPAHLRTYRGPIDKKVDVLKHYKFCFAYENTKNISGYITEKIFDCFQAATVPVYWGAPNIAQHIPSGCFIDRESFSSNEELYAYLKNMPEEQYRGYIKHIEQYLVSDAAQQYTKDHFISIFMNLITTPPKAP